MADAFEDFEHTLYDLFHNMSVPSMQGKTLGELHEYARGLLLPKAYAILESAKMPEVDETEFLSHMAWLGNLPYTSVITRSWRSVHQRIKSIGWRVVKVKS